MPKTSDHENEAPTMGQTLIQSYGEYWSKDAVDGKNTEILGHRRGYKKTVKSPTAKEKVCNVWEQRGIYALYKDFKLIYVGLASSSSGGIGSRLQSHCTNRRMKDRWDSFSWFGIDSYGTNGELKRYVATKVDESTIARTLELVAILVADPPMNRSQGKFKGAERIVQAPSRTSENISIADQLADIKKVLIEIKESQ